MQGRYVISYRWDLPAELQKLESEEKELLQESALDRAVSMMQQGYREGELCDSLRGQDVRGWWKYTAQHTQ